MEPTSPALAGEFKLNTEPPWKPIHNNNRQIKKVNKYINLCSSSIYSLRKQQKTLFPTLVLGNILKTGQMWADFWTRSKGDSDFSGRNVNCYNILWKNLKIAISSVQFSHSVMSDSLRPNELQHARPPCPSPTPGVHSNSRPSSQLCHPAISSSVVPFSCPQSLPASVFSNGSTLYMRWPKYWSFSFSISPSTFTLAISCLTPSNLPWFMDLTFHVPI